MPVPLGGKAVGLPPKHFPAQPEVVNREGPVTCRDPALHRTYIYPPLYIKGVGVPVKCRFGWLKPALPPSEFR